MSRLNRRNPYSTVRSAAEHYWRLGLEPIALETSEVGKSEIPSIPSVWSPDQLDRKFGRSDHVGVVLGPRSGELVEVQAHWQESAGRPLELLSDLPSFVREGLGFANYFARSKLRTGLIQFKVPDSLLPLFGTKQGVVLELRADGHQALVPPSLDSKGEQTRWRLGYLALRYPDDIPFVSPDRLIGKSGVLAVLAVFIRAYRRSRVRNDDLFREITSVLLHVGCDITVVNDFLDRLFCASLGCNQECRFHRAETLKAQIDESKHVADIVTVCRLLGIEPMEDLLRSWIDPFGDHFPKGPNRQPAFDKG